MVPTENKQTEISVKERLDVLLVNRGLAPSREKAKTTIMAGDVFVNGQREDKAVDSKQYAVPINRYAIILALKMPEMNFFQLNESSFVPIL